MTIWACSLEFSSCRTICKKMKLTFKTSFGPRLASGNCGLLGSSGWKVDELLGQSGKVVWGLTK